MRWLLAIVLAPLAAGLIWLVHTAAGPVPPGPAVVSFTNGHYSSYGSPSATVHAVNNGATPAATHRLRVRFVDYRDARVLADVTEPVSATIPGGQAQALTFAAPPAVTDAGLQDRQVIVTVTAWS